MASWSFPATPGSCCARGTRPAGGGLSCSRRFRHERLSSPAALWTAADQASISSTPAGSWVRQNVHSGVLCGARADRPYLRGILSAAAAHNHRAERRLGARLFDAHYIVGGPAVVANGTAATDAPLHDHAYPLARRMRASAAKSARLIQRLTESLWCSISPAMASGSHECQFPGRDSMTHGNSLPFALFSWGVAFALKRRRRHAALASQALARRRAGPARTRRPVAAAPAAARVDLLPAAGNPHICSGKSIVPVLRAVPLPSSGRTHLPVRVTVGDPPPHLFLA